MSIDSANDYAIQIEKVAAVLDAIKKTNDAIKTNPIKKATNFRQDMVVITDEKGGITASKVKKDKLLFLNNLTSPIQYQLNRIADKLTKDLDTAYFESHLAKSTKIYDLSSKISAMAANVSFDDIPNGIRNKFIVNDVLDSDLNITGTLTVAKDIHIKNAYTSVNTTIYETNALDLTQENIELQPTVPMLQVTQKGVLNIIDMYFVSNNMFLKDLNLHRLSIANDGSMGVGTNVPLEKLDVRGKMGVTGKINDVTATELNHLLNADNNIQFKLDKIAEDSYNTAEKMKSDCANSQPNTVGEINGILTTLTNAVETMQTNVELFKTNAADSKQDTLFYGDGIDYDATTNSMYTTRTSQWEVSPDGESIKFGKVKISQDTLCIDDGVTVVNVALQSQLDLKQSIAAVTGAVTTITMDDLSPSSILISDQNGKIGSDSNIGVEKLQFLIGARSPIQGQINSLNQRISDTINEFTPIADNYEIEYNGKIASKLAAENAKLGTKQDTITFGDGLDYDSNNKILKISGAVSQSYTGPAYEPNVEYWKGRYFFNDTDYLMIWYSFDNNNFLLNNGYLGKDYNLVNNGATLDASGAAVGDASADTNSGFLQMSKKIDTTGLTQCTVAFWLKKDGLNASGGDVIVSDQNAVSDGTEMNFRITRNGTGNDWKIECFGATFQTGSALADWGDGNTVWNHYCITMSKQDITNKVLIEIYKNNASTFTASSSSVWATGILNNLRIGYDGDVSRQLKGHLDDFRIYDKTLSTAEITKLRDKTTTVEYLAYGDDEYDRRVFYNDLTNLPLWYKFDSSANLTVNSGSTSTANNLINNNVVANNSNHISGSACVSFSGSTSTMTIGNFDFSTFTECSICFWLRKDVNSGSDNDVIVTSSIVSISKSNSLWSIQAFGGSFAPAWVADTNWHHYCFKFVKTTASKVLLQIYKDGKLENTLINQNAWISGTAQLQLGAFTGVLDDFRIYNRAITAGEINVLYFTGGFTNMQSFVMNTSDMIAWYKFEENYTDSSGNGYNLNNTGCVSDTTNHKVGNSCVVFNGSSYLTYDTSSIIFARDVMTICLWAYVTANGVSHIISTQNGGNGWMFQVDSANNFKYSISSTSGSIFTFGTANNPAYNSWFHVAAVLSKNTQTHYIYINGVLKSTISCKYTSNVGTTLRIGAQTGITLANYMKTGSKVDDVRIYNRALTALEVSYIYNYNNTNIDIYNNRGLLNASTSYIAVHDNEVFNTANKIFESKNIIENNGGVVEPTPINGSGGYVYVEFTNPRKKVNVVEYSMSSYFDPLQTKRTLFSGPNNTPAIGDRTADGTYISGTAINTYIEGYAGEWIKIDCGVSIILGGFLMIYTYLYMHRFPQKFCIYGTNSRIAYQDSVINILDWTKVYEQTGHPDGVDLTSRFYILNDNNIKYQYYIFVINKLNSNHATYSRYFSLQKMEFYEKYKQSITFEKDTQCEILVVGAGGSGGAYFGGGGGGGDVIHIKDAIVPAGTYFPKIGQGGFDRPNTSTNRAYSENSTSFAGIIASGGNFGQKYNNTSTVSSGGNLGGLYCGITTNEKGGNYTTTFTLGSQIVTREYNTYSGFNGGRSVTSWVNNGINGRGGGGGGGAGGDALLYDTNTQAGNGADGIPINIKGYEQYFGAGGGGSAENLPSPGMAGRGGGGTGGILRSRGSLINSLPTPNEPNSGAGGNAILTSTPSPFSLVGCTYADGESGVVIIRWKSQQPNNIATVDDVATKQNALTFSKGLQYDPSTKQLIAGGWKKDTYSLSRGNVKIYPNKISMNTSTYDVIAPIRKYPPAAMSSATATLTSSYGSGVYTASVSTTNASYPVVNCFNGVITGTGGGSAAVKYTAGTYNSSAFITSDYKGEWIKLQMPVRIYLSSIDIYRSSTNISASPANFRLYGSNNGTTWIQLLDVISAVYTSDSNKHTSSVAATSSYNQYAICVQTVAGGTIVEIAEIELYGRETLPTISAEEFYNNTTDMKAWLKFDANINDSSAKNYTASQGSATLAVYDYVEKKTGMSALKMPQTSFITLSSGAATDVWSAPSSFSISFWCKVQSHTNYQVLISCRNGGTATPPYSQGWDFVIKQNSTNMYFETFKNDGTNKTKATTDVDLGTTWRHIAATLNYISSTSITVVLYIDGVQNQSFTGDHYLPFSSSTLTIGKESEGTIYPVVNAYIDDFRMYNRVLTTQEVNVLYNIDSIRQTLNSTFGNGSIECATTTVQNIKPLYSSDTINIGKHIEILNRGVSSAIVNQGFIQPSITYNNLPVTTPVLISGDNYYYQFGLTAPGTTSSIQFNSPVVCDILIVAGGGSGAQDVGAGGSAGNLIYAKNVTIPTGVNYPIVVGAGGTNGNNGSDTTAFGCTVYGGLKATGVDGSAANVVNTINANSVVSTGTMVSNGVVLTGGTGVTVTTTTYSAPEGITATLTAGSTTVTPVQVTGNNQYYYAFTTNGSITFSANTVCDILIVGAGGSGNTGNGGGSSGGLLYATNQIIPSGQYPITVGSGGNNGDGGNSIAFGATAYGGLKAITKTGATKRSDNLPGSVIVWNQNKVALAGGGSIYSVERQYPPSALTGGTIASNTITKTPTGTPAYGAGNYTISWKSHPYNYSGDLLFDYVSGSTGVGWLSQIETNTNDQYNRTTGFSVDTTTYIGTDTTNHGQWIKIKLPVSICLTKVELYARQLAGWQFRNPLRYVVYGSNDNGANWIKLIDNTSADVSYGSIFKTTSSTANGFSEMYSYFAFAFTKVGTGNIGDCGFNEIKIYGKEITGGGGGGGGIGSAGVSATSLTSTQNGGNGYQVSIRTPDEYFAGGGGANGGTRVPASGYTIGYGGNSTSSSSTNGGDGIVIIRVPAKRTDITTLQLGGGGGGIGHAGDNADGTTDTVGVGGDGYSTAITGTSYTYSQGGFGAKTGVDDITSVTLGSGGDGRNGSLGETGGNGTVIVRWRPLSVISLRVQDLLNHCMRSKRDIWVDGADVIFTSDERIKKEIKDIDDDSALRKLLAIEPKTYKYIDYKTGGYEKVYGFISQQVRGVLPEATTQTARFIPNIYMYCYFKDNIIELPQDFDMTKIATTYNGSMTADQVRLIDENQTAHDVSFSVVFASNPPQLRIRGAMPTISNGEQIFVYGTLIDDLTTIDKSYVYTLNVCATQSLSRKIDTVGNDIATINSRAASIEDRLAALEAKMNTPSQ